MISLLYPATSGPYLNGWLAGTLIGLLIFLAFLSGFIRAVQSRNWPTAQGVVVESNVLKTSSINMNSVKQDVNFRPVVRYTYEVRGQALESNQIAIGVLTGSEAYAAGITAQYPRGAKVNVHHHAKRPHLAVLQPGRWFAPLIAAILAAAALAFVATTWVRISAARTPANSSQAQF